NYLVFRTGKGNTAYACSRTSHRAYRRFVEPDCPSRLQCHHNLAISIGEACLQQLIALIDVDGIDTIGPWPGVSLQRGLLNGAAFGTHDDEIVLKVFLVLEVLHFDVRFDFFFFRDVDDVLYRPAARRACSFWNFECP